MRQTLQVTSALVLAAMLVGNALAGTPVSVAISGEVEFRGGPLSPQMAEGDPVDISFMVDSDNFVDGAMFPTRGYVVEDFSMTTGPTTWGLQDPYVGVPYFILRDNDPAVDGFLFGSDPDVGFPNGIALDQFGFFDQFRINYATTYGGDRLSSLDIVDAAGTYNFDGISVFSFGMLDGGIDAAGFLFAEMTITVVPEPGTLGLLLLGLVSLLRCQP